LCKLFQPFQPKAATAEAAGSHGLGNCSKLPAMNLVSNGGSKLPPLTDMTFLASSNGMSVSTFLLHFLMPSFIPSSLY
jgi:hypothetical protein